MFFLINVSAYSEEISTKSYTIYIKVPLMPKISFQKIQTNMNIDKNIFSYSYDVKTLNHIDFIETSESNGKVEGKIINGKHLANKYKYETIRGGKKRTIEFDYLNEEINNVMVNPPYDKNNLNIVTNHMIRESIDPIMLFLKLTNYEYIEGCKAIFMVFDGKRRYDISLSHKTIDSNFLTCLMEQNKIGGYKDKQMLKESKKTKLIYKKDSMNDFRFHSVEFNDDFFSIIIM